VLRRPPEIRRFVAVVALLAASGTALASCGGDDDTQPTEPTPEPQQQASEDVLQRRDAPPAGVADQVSFFGIGDGSCSEMPAGPTVNFFSAETGEVPSPATVEMGNAFRFCLAGFDPAAAIDVSVQFPDGSTQTRSVGPAQGSAPRFLDWDPVPGDPLGSYEVTASQASATATGEFTVELASEPGIRVPEGVVAPGDRVQIALTGFQPDETVPLHVYGPQPSGTAHGYLTTLESRVDHDGQLLYELGTSADDPEGLYYVTLDEAAGEPEVEANSSMRGPVTNFVLGEV
jgi:hypothetical protein